MVAVGRVAGLARKRNYRIGSLASFFPLHRIGCPKVNLFTLPFNYIMPVMNGVRVS